MIDLMRASKSAALSTLEPLSVLIRYAQIIRPLLRQSFCRSIPVSKVLIYAFLKLVVFHIGSKSCLASQIS